MSDEFKPQLPNLLPDATIVRVDGEDGTAKARLICVRCASAAKPKLRLYATLSGIGDHITGKHHEAPAFYKNHTPDELKQEVTTDDGE